MFKKSVSTMNNSKPNIKSKIDTNANAQAKPQATKGAKISSISNSSKTMKNPPGDKTAGSEKLVTKSKTSGNISKLNPSKNPVNAEFKVGASANRRVLSTRDLIEQAKKTSPANFKNTNVNANESVASSTSKNSSATTNTKSDVSAKNTIEVAKTVSTSIQQKSDSINRNDPATKSIISEISNFSNSLVKTLVLVKNSKENVIFSPLCLSSVLTLFKPENGGQFSNQQEKEENKDSSLISTAIYRQIFNSLTSNRNFRILTFNRIYIDKSKNIHASADFEQKTKDFVEVKTIDFSQGEAATDEINRWIRHASHNRVKQIVDSNDLSRRCKMMILTASHFKGQWKTEFDPRENRKAKFHLSNDPNDWIRVDMMFQEFYFFPRIYLQELDADVFSLDYKGDRLCMIFFVPKFWSGLPKIINGLQNFNTPSTILTQLKVKREIVRLFIPKFTIDLKMDMKDDLEKLGRKFSGILSSQSSAPSFEPLDTKFIHKTTITVDEKGTEAATATFPREAAAPVLLRIKKLKLNRPFYFQIVDKFLDVVLYAGVCRRPTESKTRRVGLKGFFIESTSTSSSSSMADKAKKAVTVGICKLSGALFTAASEETENGLSFKIPPDNSNLMYSALSLSACVVMLKLGARGETAQEIQKILQYPLKTKEQEEEEKAVLQNFGEILSKLSTNKEIKFSSTHDICMNRNEIKILPKFIQLVQNEKHFKNCIQILDFSPESDSNKSTLEKRSIENGSENGVNSNVNVENINRKYKTEIKSGPQTQLILVSGVYFQGRWMEEFIPYYILKSRFFLSEKPGDFVIVDMMTGWGIDNLPWVYSLELDADIFILDYQLGGTCLMIFLPRKRNGLLNFRGVLEIQKLSTPSRIAREMIQLGSCVVSFPKFRTECSLDLTEPLKQIGINKIFGGGDLTGMSASRNARVSKCLHHVEISFNSLGTNVPEVIDKIFLHTQVAPPGEPEVNEYVNDHPVFLIVNRPFYYQIVDKTQDLIILSGVCTNPTRTKKK